MTYKKEILFIGNDFDKFDHDILFPIIRAMGVNIKRVHPSEISVFFSTDSATFYHDNEVLRPDLVVGWVFEDILHLGINILEAFERNGVPVINKGHVLYCAQNKYINTAMMQAAGVPFPGALSGKKLSFIRKHHRKFNFPLVIKPIIGFGGHGIHKIMDETELFDLLESSSGEYYLQPFINNPGRDIRIICINHKVVNAIYRIAKDGEWITNLSSGATPVYFEPSEELIKIAEKASLAAGTLYSGLDIIECLAENNYQVLEVNSCPSTHYAYTNSDEEPRILYYLADYLVQAAHDYERAINFWKPCNKAYIKVKESV
ncbi:hypothetical protein HVA01_01850 [Halovibrio variabilis]|uniref:ATP-grasp domain-containing protein n=1 Tax=Halovibrio variabilis TaxID=31910 RepID=A0A511UIZ2_9GAMM|nr:ATP-grasp domain-containing protein [Halovibrio variabilis]GEN26539.1 hypothetical protein HVA01_01850 [Halovibrio variabilis]